MTDTQAGPATPPQSSNTTPITSASDQPAHAQLRNRFVRQSLAQRPPSQSQSRPRRRSSILSYGSLDGGSFHEDFIQPSTTKRENRNDHEITHWSSTPLAFAILPAVAGLVFKNGSAFVTDVLLLTLAAVFMNWSIRVPREWYHSAQAVLQDIEPEDDVKAERPRSESAIIEEEDTDSNAKGSAPEEEEEQEPQDSVARERAASQLRMQELLALVACFVLPIGAAYLLHVIRSQLSRPSESLVSDYNLSIFVLAAEFWPARQVIRLVAARTLHLQRIASGLDETGAESSTKTSLRNIDLLARVDALETQLTGDVAGNGTATPTKLQLSDLASLDAKIQKRLEPRLDSLERALRRYEKRYATMAMVTEQRFQNLETRLQDTLSLAAVAAQHSQNSTGVLRSVVMTGAEIVMLPAKLAWELVIWPVKVLDEIVDRFKVLMLGPKASNKTDTKRKTTRPDLKMKDDKVPREKVPRKLVK